MDPLTTGSPRPPKSLKRPTPYLNHSTPVKSTQSIYDAPESRRKTVQPTKATAPTVTLDEADEIVPPAPVKPQRPPPLFIHDKGRWPVIQPASATDFRNLSALLATLKVAYHTYSLKDEREFRVVLRGVPKEIPIEEVKEDLLTQDLPVQSVRRITNRAREPLDLVLVTANTGTDIETKRSFYRIKANTMDQHSPCPPGAGGSGPKKQITFEFIQQVFTKALSEIGYEAPQELVNKLIARVTPVSSRASSRAAFPIKTTKTKQTSDEPIVV
ncbi:hypothetical protein EVAR_30733_1 [Eumeta japonica]|uniref:Pre-C2HC domain-containing protein n=1 Tax=Eumeta variegata TaxID=151549 RepID=A0A4C1V6N2_EUMVA|nr:hypothetical protein EVAR_30733_1 [Eumeta japonica]